MLFGLKAKGAAESASDNRYLSDEVQEVGSFGRRLAFLTKCRRQAVSMTFTADLNTGVHQLKRTVEQGKHCPSSPITL
jgi:hypothetical protein